MTAVLGWAVGVLDVVQFLPQLRRALALRHHHEAVRDLSVWTWTIATIQGTAWVVYVFADGLLPIALPNVVITPAGRSAIELAAPGHVSSVRRLVIDRLTDEQIDALAAIGDAVRASLQADGQQLADDGACPVDARTVAGVG